MLGFSTVACKLVLRGGFSGWALRLREKNLPPVVDNPRLLTLTWITIPNPGLAHPRIARRGLPKDWTERYNITPVLIETSRYTGAVYRASGWTRVVTTQGAGATTDTDKPRKKVWLRLPHRNWKQDFNR